MLSLSKQIPVQLLLCNATSNHIFWLPNEKKLQNFIQRKNAEKNKEECVKKKHLSGYIYSIAYL